MLSDQRQLPSLLHVCDNLSFNVHNVHLHLFTLKAMEKEPLPYLITLLVESTTYKLEWILNIFYRFGRIYA